MVEETVKVLLALAWRTVSRLRVVLFEAEEQLCMRVVMTVG
jgi:hypothetical protein